MSKDPYQEALAQLLGYTVESPYDSRNWRFALRSDPAQEDIPVIRVYDSNDTNSKRLGVIVLDRSRQPVAFSWPRAEHLHSPAVLLNEVPEEWKHGDYMVTLWHLKGKPHEVGDWYADNGYRFPDGSVPSTADSSVGE